MDFFSCCMQRLAKHHSTASYHLSELLQLASILKNPQKSFPSIHITGTNGKGSVCHKIAKALSLAGYKVGLFTSPHLYCYTERIIVAGEPITKDEVVQGLEMLFSLAKEKGFSLSSFAYTTLLAMLHFQKRQVDIAVIEVGIGGRLDATVIVDPILCIITSISLEHTQILGDTIEKIAYEKAGIFKPSVPVLLGPKAFVATAVGRASELDCPLYHSQIEADSFDRENSCIARDALSILSKSYSHLNAEIIQQAISSRPPCRLEVMGQFIFDVAHNPSAIERLLHDVESLYPQQNFDVIFGIAEDKDVASCLQHIASKARRIILTSSQTSRSAKLADMAEMLNKFSCKTPIFTHSVRDAVFLAGQDKQALILVCGSFYIMDEAKKEVMNLLSLER